MSTLRFLSHIVLILLASLPGAYVYAQDSDRGKDTIWDSYIRTIDPYVSDKDKEPTKDEAAGKQVKPAPVVEKLRPLPPGASPEAISEHNRRMQKALRDQNKQDMHRMFDEIERFDQKPDPTPRVKDGFTVGSTNSIVKSGYLFRKTNFNWGGKDSGYKYVDYEITFESTNREHTSKMSASISEMALAGWEVDLNRSFQRVQGSGDNAKAYITMQMRFRRPK